MKTALEAKREQVEASEKVVGEFVFGPDYYPVLMTITQSLAGGYSLNRYFFIGSKCEVSYDVNNGTLQECVEHMSAWSADFHNRMSEVDK